MSGPTTRAAPSHHRPRRRSVGFIDREGETWACFLVTFQGQDDRWHGYLSFRPREGDMQEDEVRTADIFLEDSEGEIDESARGLGRPLLTSLLASALHTFERAGGGTPRLRRWFRSFLAEDSLRLADGLDGEDPARERDLDLPGLTSLYASYRLDQVAHFIALLQPEAFEEAVDRILDGQSIDFRAKDRLQLAMLVVEHIESRLPLPPFEVWARDYRANRDAYRLYAHTLHRERRLP